MRLLRAAGGHLLGEVRLSSEHSFPLRSRTQTGNDHGLNSGWKGGDLVGWTRGRERGDRLGLGQSARGRAQTKTLNASAMKQVESIQSPGPSPDTDLHEVHGHPPKILTSLSLWPSSCAVCSASKISLQSCSKSCDKRAGGTLVTVMGHLVRTPARKLHAHSFSQDRPGPTTDSAAETWRAPTTQGQSRPTSSCGSAPRQNPSVLSQPEKENKTPATSSGLLYLIILNVPVT